MTVATHIERSPADIQTQEQDMDKFLCFLLGDKSYGVNILKVKEIIEHTDITPVPMTPDFFLGAINLRGRMVPVIDMARRLGMAAGTVSRRTCIVILELEMNHGRMEMGVMVDGVSQVADIPADQVEPAPALGGLRTDFMRGMGKVNNRFVILLNIECVLSMDDVALLKGINDSASPMEEAPSWARPADV